MPLHSGIVMPGQSTGGPGVGDGDIRGSRINQHGDVCESPLIGSFGLQNYRANEFTGNTGNAGVVIHVSGDTAQTFVVWNPAGSNRLLVPTKLAISTGVLNTANAQIQGVYNWGYRTDAGSQVGNTSSAITAATFTTPISANINGGGVSSALFSLNVTTKAPNFLRNVGLSEQFALNAQLNFWVQQNTEYYNGDFIVGPGTAIYLQRTVASGTSETMLASLTWYEVPI